MSFLICATNEVFPCPINLNWAWAQRTTTQCYASECTVNPSISNIFPWVRKSEPLLPKAGPLVATSDWKIHIEQYQELRNRSHGNRQHPPGTKYFSLVQITAICLRCPSSLGGLCGWGTWAEEAAICQPCRREREIWDWNIQVCPVEVRCIGSNIILSSWGYWELEDSPTGRTIKTFVEETYQNNHWRWLKKGHLLDQQLRPETRAVFLKSIVR